MTIHTRVSEIQNAIDQYAHNRPVTLVAVSKYASIEQMREAYDAGIRHFGENKMQDALNKMMQLPAEISQQVHWHFIGHLQANKVKKTVNRFAWLHTIDSIRLASMVSECNLTAGLVQSVLLQINLSEDDTRQGFLKEQVTDALREMMSLKGIAIRGLMGMAPPEVSLGSNEEKLKSIFGGLRALRDRLQDECQSPLPELSMGMSHDFIHALSCGATIIRIGNYLFKN